MNEKINWRIFIILFFIFAIVCGGAYFLGRADKGVSGSTGSNTTEQRRINDEIGREQQLALDGIRGTKSGIIEGQRGIDASLEFVERVRGITYETNSIIAELWHADRRSSDIYQSIREELKVLEDYFRGISGILDDYDNNTGSE
jgi:hypothetical protein